jgi:hypothetical protein
MREHFHREYLLRGKMTYLRLPGQKGAEQDIQPGHKAHTLLLCCRAAKDSAFKYREDSLI